MAYYFPIKINDRRLHFLHLVDTQESQPSPVFSFIIKNYDSPLLLSVESNEPKLIAQSGFNYNERLDNWSFGVEKVDNAEEIPTFRINIQKKSSQNEDNCVLKSTGCNETAKVNIDSTMVGDLKEFIVIVSYQKQDHTKQVHTYEDAIRIYLYENDPELESAALDFGSEASQIRFGGSTENMAIIDTLLKFTGEDNPIRENEFWQGKCGDQFYKSVFFVDRNPDLTSYGDTPQIADNAFVKPLMPKNRANYDNLELLPNLKLIELSQDQIIYGDAVIQFPEGSTVEDGSLSEDVFRGSILRIILSNFLHCMLQRKFTGNKCKLLRMVVMVPNVYYQSKIYNLIRDLYLDYQIIQNGEHRYEQCRGLEVQVVSESDASFIGVRHTRNDVKNATNGLFLIVDAGKGTTDFSILQQTANFAKFVGLYRDGLPASGNVLTYAFYEALHEFMRINSKELNKFIREASRSELLYFMENLEKLKYNYNSSNNREFENIPSYVDNLVNLNTYLQKQIELNRQIPNCKNFVNEKIVRLTKSLETSIKNYMSTISNPQFIQVLLTGRGFLFDPFKKSVIDMLKTNKWINNEKDDVIRIEGNDAKTICLSGALSIERECSVNCNSGLIGNPIIQKTKSASKTKKTTPCSVLLSSVLLWLSKSTFIQWVKRQISQSHGTPSDIDFYYNGVTKRKQNITVTIGGRHYRFGADGVRDTIIYFVGDGFLRQIESESSYIEERNFGYSDGSIDQLIKQALFPFVSASLLPDGIIEESQSETSEQEEPNTEIINPEDLSTDNRGEINR